MPVGAAPGRCGWAAAATGDRTPSRRRRSSTFSALQNGQNLMATAPRARTRSCRRRSSASTRGLEQRPIRGERAIEHRQVGDASRRPRGRACSSTKLGVRGAAVNAADRLVERQRCAGYQPPAGLPLAILARDRGVDAEQRRRPPRRESREPAASGTPVSSIVRHAYAPLIRSAPTRCSAHGMSLVACVGCIEAMTPRSSQALDVLRRDHLGVLDAQPADRRRASRRAASVGVERGVPTAASPIAWIATCQPSRPRPRRRAASAAGSVTHRPLVARVVAVRRVAAGAARAERAVGEELHAAQRERPSPSSGSRLALDARSLAACSASPARYA